MTKLLVVLAAICVGPFSVTAQSDAVLEALDIELKRSVEGFADQDPAPYFISYGVTEVSSTLMMAQYGVPRGLEGDYPADYNDEDAPYTPAWSEKYTGMDREILDLR